MGAESDVCLREKKRDYNRFKINVPAKIFWSNKDEKSSTFSTIYTKRLQNLQTSLSRFDLLLLMRLKQTGDKIYMQNFGEKNVGRFHIKDGEWWKMVQ